MCDRLSVLSEAVFENKDNVYISGIAGSGKSYLLKQLYDEAVKRKLNSVLTSTTGVSSFNISGCTIHSFTGIILPSQMPKDIQEFMSRIVTKIKFKRYLLKKWQNLKILFIDEVSMLGANYIDVIDNIARRVRGVNSPFGGIQVVSSGDFLQLPPVGDFFCFESPCWSELNFKNYVLTKAYRFTEQKWNDILQRARIGKLTSSDISYLRKCINKKNNSDIQPTVIYSLKKDVDDINEVALDDIDEKSYIYEALDYMGEEIQTTSEQEEFKIIRNCTEEQSKVLDSNLNVKRKVTLKKGAQVMLLANLDVSEGLVNGSRGIITKIDENEVTVKFKGKNHEFEEIIKAYDFKIEYQEELLVRKMLPLIPAYASTVHKMQGLTIDCGIVNCGDSIFSPGQAYVALSRVRSLEGLFLESLKPEKIYPNKKALQFEEEMKKDAFFIDEI
jgi:ATP-dependent DNA helicase PIF1